MQSLNIVNNIFAESSRFITESAPVICESVTQAANLMAKSLASGGKILACGNGGSASDAQHFSAELLNRYLQERPPLAACALNCDGSTLTAIGNDYSFNQVFSKQIKGLGRAHDVLLAITTSGNSSNIINAIDAAHQQQMRCVILNGRDGGGVNVILQSSDINICVPGNITARIQEVHGLVIHCLCELIDLQLFGRDT